ncbi:hypothetical protein ABZ605_32390 [Streptomyces sp. NPDC012765]|uniref:hypothetical protein n=1 Tax=Streptomyces sp. NPDC012765 TaxID=3155249 RepID=UPI0033EA3881
MTGGLFDDEPTSAPTGKGLMGSGVGLAIKDVQVVVKPLPGTTLDSIPAPYAAAGQGELSPQEQADLEACKAGMNNLHNAFWIAGKSLETMKSGNLQRQEHPNFAEFVWENWEVSESQMHRLTEAWRIGEALAQLGYKPRESQVRELTGIAKESGDQKAVVVYDSVARNVKRVTAAVLAGVVEKLPPLNTSSISEILDMVTAILTTPEQRTSPEISSSAAAPQADPGSPVSESVPEEAPQEQEAGPAAPAPSPTASGQAAASSAPAPQPPAAPNPMEDADIMKLVAVANLLEKAARTVSAPAVRRATERFPELTESLITKIRANGEAVGRALGSPKQ